MMKLFDFIRLPLEGKLSPRVTDEVETSMNTKHIARRSSSTPSHPGEGSRSRRGFTLVELVIALTIIVLVSGVSIGVVMVNTNTHNETIDMIEATNIAENAVECFRFAVRNTTDKTNKTKIIDTFKQVFTHTEALTEVEGETNAYLVQDGRVKVKLVFSDSDSDLDTYLDSITITATNGGTNEFLIEKVTYRVR